MNNEEAIKIIKDFCTVAIKRNHELQGQLLLDQEEIDDLWLAVDYIESIINRNTAEWIKQKSGDELFPEEIVCSKCYHSNSHLDFDEHNNPIGKVFLESKYCPNCGSRMKGGTE